MKQGKWWVSLLLAAVLSVGVVSQPILAEEAIETESETEYPATYYEEIQSNNIKGWPQGGAVEADAAIVMDAETGAILYAKDIEDREYPASITKIMTVLIALEKGNLSDVVKFSENAVYSIEFGSSHLGLTEGEELTLEQCLYGIMLASANEISNAVAEHIGGSIEDYVQMMNDRAAELGCTNTHFVNVHGLHDENHYVCAKDMALIMREALKNEKFREIIHTVEYHYPETNKVDEVRYFMNHHKMISEEGMLYDGCIGGKTGYTDEAGNTLVTAAEKDGRTIITVVLKTPGLYVSYDNTRLLLDYAFENFKDEMVEIKNTPELEITGVEDAQELEKIRSANLLEAPFSMVGSAKVTLPAEVQVSSLKEEMDFTTNQISWSYEDQTMGSIPFTYTGEWETEAPTETVSEMQTTAETEEVTENAALKEGTVLNKVGGFFAKAFGGVGFLYEKMDVFIKENTVIASVIGAVLLLIFVPLLFIAIVRGRKYQRIMELREEEMEERRRLEEELEKKSAAQVEAELRAEELQEKLEEERRSRKQRGEESADPEDSEDFYYDEENTSGAESAELREDVKTENVPQESETEDEYIEVPVEDGEPLDGEE